MKNIFKNKLIQIALLLCIGIVVGFILLAPKDKLDSQISPGFIVLMPINYLEKIAIKMGDFDFGIRPLFAQASGRIESENKISYFDAYPFVDVVYSTSSNKLKEDIILKSPGHPMEFLYELDLVNFIYQFDKSKNLVFYPKDEKIHNLNKIFTIEAPYVIDATGKKTLPGEVEMSINESGQLQIILNQAWFETAVYPVILDPTIEIHILNLYSHPKQGDDWTVDFTTQGQADLKIIPADQATIDDDEFLSLSCNGQTVLPKILPGDVIFYPNWQCSGTGQVVHFTKKAGKHTLRFEFGDQVAFAYNSPGDLLFTLDFEEGDLTDFDNTLNESKNKFAASDTQLQSGRYSLTYEVTDVDSSYAYGSKTFTSTDYLFLDFYVYIYREVRFDTDLATDLLVSLTSSSNPSEQHEVGIGIRRNDMFDSRVNEFMINGRHVSDSFISGEYANDTWKHFTIEYKAGDGDGYVIVNIDNTEVLNQSNLSNAGDLVDRVNFGHLDTNTAYEIGSIIYFDSINGYEEAVITTQQTLDVQGVYNFQGQVNISAE